MPSIFVSLFTAHLYIAAFLASSLHLITVTVSTFQRYAGASEGSRLIYSFAKVYEQQPQRDLSYIHT